jgi:hypothetical protein
MVRTDLARALLISAIVGSLLSYVHCREMFRQDGLIAFCNWHVYISYLVPFTVSLTSSVLARRKRAATASTDVSVKARQRRG